MSQANEEMIQRWKGYMLEGVNKMTVFSPIDTPKIAELKALIQALPTELEPWNSDDKAYQVYFQKEVNFRVDFIGKFVGVNGKFYEGAWTIFRYALSSIREIAADDHLKTIGEKLAEICDLVKESVAGQNADSLYLALYERRLADLAVK